MHLMPERPRAAQRRPGSKRSRPGFRSREEGGDEEEGGDVVDELNGKEGGYAREEDGGRLIRQRHREEGDLAAGDEVGNIGVDVEHGVEDKVTYCESNGGPSKPY